MVFLVFGKVWTVEEVMGLLRSPGHYFCRLEETVGSPGTSTFVVVTRNLYMSLAWLGPAAWLGLGTLGRLAWLVRGLSLEFFNAKKIICNKLHCVNALY